MKIPTFKMHTIRQVWPLVQEADYAFSFDLKDAYLNIPIVNIGSEFTRISVSMDSP